MTMRIVPIHFSHDYDEQNKFKMKQSHSGGSIGGGGDRPPPLRVEKIFFFSILILFIIEKNSFLL